MKTCGSCSAEWPDEYKFCRMCATPLPILEVNGVNGSIRLFPDRIRISRSGVLTWLSHGSKGDKDILLKSITSIQFKKPGLTSGYIQFAYSGSSESKAGVWDAAQDENTVMFSGAQLLEFERIRDAINVEKSKLEQPMLQPQLVRNPDFVDQIERLAGLRDRGIVSEEEFQAKKRSLLGL